jgi:hypothetical protein
VNNEFFTDSFISEEFNVGEKKADELFKNFRKLYLKDFDLIINPKEVEDIEYLLNKDDNLYLCGYSYESAIRKFSLWFVKEVENVFIIENACFVSDKKNTVKVYKELSSKNIQFLTI